MDENTPNPIKRNKKSLLKSRNPNLLSFNSNNENEKNKAAVFP